MRPLFAACVGNSEYPAYLEIHKICRVIPGKGAERDGDLRIIDERGEDHLYASRYFVPMELPQET